MLSNTLNTNEIKDRTGTEVEFQRLNTRDRSTEFAKISEQPNYPHRLIISHDETGVGINRKRRSLLRFSKTVAAADAGSDESVVISAYVVVDLPIGKMSSFNDANDVLANLMSFLSTTGAGTTVLFDGSGNGASALINGTY